MKNKRMGLKVHALLDWHHDVQLLLMYFDILNSIDRRGYIKINFITFPICLILDLSFKFVILTLKVINIASVEQ